MKTVALAPIAAEILFLPRHEGRKRLQRKAGNSSKYKKTPPRCHAATLRLKLLIFAVN
jgi:hypothetical protein